MSDRTPFVIFKGYTVPDVKNITDHMHCGNPQCVGCNLESIIRTLAVATCIAAGEAPTKYNVRVTYEGVLSRLFPLKHQPEGKKLADFADDDAILQDLARFMNQSDAGLKAEAKEGYLVVTDAAGETPGQVVIKEEHVIPRLFDQVEPSWEDVTKRTTLEEHFGFVTEDVNEALEALVARLKREINEEEPELPATQRLCRVVTMIATAITRISYAVHVFNEKEEGAGEATQQDDRA